MKEILVVGGGFAGVWSAAGAVRRARAAGDDGDELHVTLVSDRDDLVVRPRLYKANPESMRVPLNGILDPIGVSRVTARVVSIDVAEHTVQTLSSLRIEIPAKPLS